MTSKVRFVVGDVREGLKKLPAGSVQCVVTSPPYWGLRDYGMGGQIGGEAKVDCLGWAAGAKCGECYVCHMVEVFRSVGRVLREDGVAWLNLGDCYAGPAKGSDSGWSNSTLTKPSGRERRAQQATRCMIGRKKDFGVSDGNLVGVPWRVAFALQADGWVLRQDNVWSKKSCMPESVRNRFTKSHEYVFQMVKKMGYFFDAEAVKVPVKRVQETSSQAERKAAGATGGKGSVGIHGPLAKTTHLGQGGGTANRRTVWEIDQHRYPKAHFATFPPKLPEICLKAGASERGACTQCGAPWRRVLETKKLKRERPNEYVKRRGDPGTGNSCANDVAGVESKTLGWYPSCGCDRLPKLRREPTPQGGEPTPAEQAEHDAWLGRTNRLIARAAPVKTRPCLVCDPFSGAGTTALVAVRLGLDFFGSELNPDYVRMSEERVAGATKKPTGMGLLS